MGGYKSQLGGEFVNIDISESIKVGIKGDATKLSKIIKKNSIDELVSNNPYLGGVFTAEDYIKEVAEVMKPGSRVYINGQRKNPFFSEVNNTLATKYGFTIDKYQVDLLDNFKKLKFYTSQGHPISINTMKSTVLIKN